MISPERSIFQPDQSVLDLLPIDRFLFNFTPYNHHEKLLKVTINSRILISIAVAGWLFFKVNINNSVIFESLIIYF